MENTKNNIIHFVQTPKGLVIISVCVVALLGVYLFLSSQSNQIAGITTAPTPTIGQATSNGIKNNNAQQPKPSPTIDTAIQTAQLSFVKEGSWVDLVLDTGTTPVSGVQVSIAYNPALITNISISPGTFFISPTILQNKIDVTNGTISYVIAIPPGEQQKTGKGTIASISYQLSPGNTTTMTFLPATKITSVGVNGSVLRAAEPISLP